MFCSIFDQSDNFKNQFDKDWTFSNEQSEISLQSLKRTFL